MDSKTYLGLAIILPYPEWITDNENIIQDCMRRCELSKIKIFGKTYNDTLEHFYHPYEQYTVYYTNDQDDEDIDLDYEEIKNSHLFLFQKIKDPSKLENEDTFNDVKCFKYALNNFLNRHVNILDVFIVSWNTLIMNFRDLIKDIVISPQPTKQDNRERQQQKKQRKQEAARPEAARPEAARPEAARQPAARPDCPSFGIEPKKCEDKEDYRRQSRIFHPDKNKGCIDEATEKYQIFSNLEGCNKEAYTGGKIRKTIKNKSKKLNKKLKTKKIRKSRKLRNIKRY